MCHLTFAGFQRAGGLVEYTQNTFMSVNELLIFLEWWSASPGGVVLAYQPNLGYGTPSDMLCHCYGETMTYECAGEGEGISNDVTLTYSGRSMRMKVGICRNLVA